MQKPQQKTPPVSGSDLAPTVYFDGTYAWGAYNGVIQIELGANQMVPADVNSDKVRTKVVCMGHLRCSEAAATQLRDALDKVLETFDAARISERAAKLRGGDGG